MWEKKTKLETALEKQIDDLKAEHKQTIANMRADHASELAGIRQDRDQVIGTLNSQIERLQMDLDRTRLYLHPELKHAGEDDEPPPAASGTPSKPTRWSEFLNIAIAEQDQAAKEQDARQKSLQKQAMALQGVDAAKSGNAQTEEVAKGA